MRSHYWISAPYRAERDRLLTGLDLPPLLATVDAHRNLRGPYTAVGTLLRLIGPDALLLRPELAFRHRIEIQESTPELTALVPVVRRPLEQSAKGPGSVSRYPARLHSLRISHGLVDFLGAYLEALDDGPRGLVVHNVQHADATDREFLAVLLRRLPAERLPVEPPPVERLPVERLPVERLPVEPWPVEPWPVEPPLPAGSAAAGAAAAALPRPRGVFRSRAGRLVTAGAVLAAVAAGVGVYAGVSRDHPPATAAAATWSATDPGTHVSASAAVIPEVWGTEFQLKLAGLPSNITCRLVVYGSDGRSETAGTWGSGYAASASVPASTSISPSQITQLDVVSGTGTVLVRVPPG